MKRRDLRLDKYGISKKRYMELKGYCEQYPEWKVKIKEIALLPSRTFDGTPKAPNKGASNPVLKSVVKLEYLTEDCSMIEHTAKMASEELWEYLIKQICYDVPINYLIMVEKMPLSKSAFYELRRYFFYLLDIEKKKDRERKYIDVNHEDAQESTEKKDIKK